MATMKRPTSEPHFAGDIADVHGLNGHKLTDAERREVNGAVHAAPAARLNGSAAAIGHNSGSADISPITAGSTAAMAERVLHPNAVSAHATPRQGFEAIVSENLRRGLYLTQRDVLIYCIRDLRLKPRHRLVLAAIIEHTNAKSGVAFPGRRALAQNTAWYDPAHDWVERHYTEPGVGKTISELIDFGYLAWIKRAPDGGGRALAHYTMLRPTFEELQAQITAYIHEIRKRGPHDLPDFKRQPDVTPVGNVTPGGDVTSVGNIRKADVTPVVPADVTPVVPTVTSKEVTSRKKVSADAPASPPLKVAGPTQAEIDAGFDEWWALYPRKEDRLDAKRAYTALVSGKRKDGVTATIPQLLAAVKGYRPPEPKYTKLPATWLNKGYWQDGAGVAFAAGSLDDEVRKAAGSDSGKALIQELGADAGMKRLKEIVIENRRTRGLD